MIEINVANTVKGDQSKRKSVTYIYAIIVFIVFRLLYQKVY